MKPRRKRKVKAPEAVPPPKVKRPKRALLRRYYKELICADRDQRIETLAQAMHWYAQAIAWLAIKQKGEWELEQLKLKSAAEKSRGNGIDATLSATKEKHFIDAVHYYEKLAASMTPALIDPFLEKLKKNEDGLNERREKLRNKFGDFLTLLAQALRPCNPDGKRISLRIDKINAPHRIDSEGNITFDRKVVMNMRKLARKNGILTAVLQVIPVFSEAASRLAERDPKGFKTGRYVVDNKKRYNSVLTMLSALNQYSLTDEAPRKLVRRPKPKKEKKEGS